MAYNNGYYGNANGFYPYSNIPGGENSIKQVNRSVRLRIFTDSLILCSAVCCYSLFSDLFGVLLNSFERVKILYTYNTVFRSCTEMLYSFVCVGLPFLAVFVFIRLFCREKTVIDFGKVYDRKNAVLLVISGLGVCFLGNLADSFIIDVLGKFGINFYSYEQALTGTELPANAAEFIAMSIRTALVPAFVEEFAFRGVMLQTLRKYGDWIAIGITAFLFGLMHGNFTQVPFALIAGTALGFICVVTGSIWPSVILHFLNNFISVIYSILLASEPSRAMVRSMLMTYGIIFIGAAAFAVYLMRNKDGLRLRRGKYPQVPGRVPAFLLSPSCIAACVFLVGTMMTDII